MEESHLKAASSVVAKGIFPTSLQSSSCVQPLSSLTRPPRGNDPQGESSVMEDSRAQRREALASYLLFSGALQWLALCGEIRVT